MAFAKANIYPVGGNPKAGKAPTLWMYYTTDLGPVVDGAGYFDNGATTNTGMRDLMKVGDLVIRLTVNDVDAPTSVTHAGFHIVNSVASGIIDVTDATVLINTDSD